MEGSKTGARINHSGQLFEETAGEIIFSSLSLHYSSSFFFCLLGGNYKNIKTLLSDAMTITRDEDVLGGKARVEGSRVSVEQIYEMYKLQGMKPEAIAQLLPTLSPEEVKEAIKYREDQQASTASPASGVRYKSSS